MISKTFVWRTWTEDNAKPAPDITEAMIVTDRVAELRAIQELSAVAVKMENIATTGPMLGFKQPGLMLEVLVPGRDRIVAQIMSYSLSGQASDNGLVVSESLTGRRFKDDY